MTIITNSKFSHLYNLETIYNDVSLIKLKGETFKAMLIRIGSEIVEKSNHITVLNIYKNHREIVPLEWHYLRGKSIHSLTCILWKSQNKIRSKFVLTRIRFAYLNFVDIKNILTLGIVKISGSATNIYGLPIYEISNIYNAHE